MKKVENTTPVEPTKEELAKQEAIHKIMDDAENALKALGVNFFIGVVDKQPEKQDLGKAYAVADCKGEDFVYILDMALPTKQDVINLGIWVGQLIQARNANTPKNLQNG